MPNRRGRGTTAALVLLILLLLAAGNVILFAQAGAWPAPIVTEPGSGISAASFATAVLNTVRSAWLQRPVQFICLLAAHGLAAAALLLLGASAGATPETASPPAAEPPAEDPLTPTLRLLALLQQEGRFIDFIEEEIEPYNDQQVGAAVRAIHAGCRKVLRERIRVERIFDEEDGSSVEIAPGFDTATVRLTGNVRGDPPFRGTLQHAGWRCTEVHLPKTPAIDSSILAPAEVEIP